MRILLVIFVLLMSGINSSRAQGCLHTDARGQVSADAGLDLGNNRYFLVGELHSVYCTPAIKLALIKYAHERYGVNNVFLEIGYSTAWLYNRYLQTGDTMLFTQPAITYAYAQPDRNFWKALYDYNRQQRKKLEVHGMDFERWDFAKALQLMMPAGKARPVQARSVLHLIDSINVKVTELGDRYRGNSGKLKIYDSIRNNVERNRKVLQKYYGKNFEEVERILLNENRSDRYNERNARMYDNVVQAVKEEKIKRYILFCGLNHANKEGGYNLFSKLVSDKHFHNHAVTISMLCKNCYDRQMGADSALAPFLGPMVYQSDTASMSSIFRSYYNGSCSFPLLRSAQVADKKVSSFSDYLLLMNDQPEF